MQLTKITLAIAAFVAATAAVAAPSPGSIAISSGASATKGNLAIALGNLCTQGGGTLSEFISGGNVSTYVCADTAVTGATYASKAPANFRNFAGTAFVELRLNVGGGSFTSVCLLNGFPAGTACPVADTFVNPATGALAAIPAGSAIAGGLLDTEASAFPSNVTQGLTVPGTTRTGIAQTFGVAVSNDLYTAMFNDQKSAGGATVAKPIPSTCVVTDTARVECMPTIGKAQMGTIMANNEFNAAYSNGAAFLAPSQLAAGTNLRYARRANTSGTQSSAQVYFLGTQCSPRPITVVPEGNGSTGTQVSAITVYGFAGTGDVRTNLNQPGFAIGIISGENAARTDATWKWLRVQGAPLSENAAVTPGVTATASTVNGGYDFYFESVVTVTSNPSVNTFWGRVSGALGAINPPVGLINNSQLQSTYNKGGFTCSLSNGV